MKPTAWVKTYAVITCLLIGHTIQAQERNDQYGGIEGGVGRENFNSFEALFKIIG